MKKFIKLISCGVATMALIFSAQICAMAAITNDTASSHVVSSHVVSGREVSSHVVAGAETVSGASHLNDIAPYNNAGTVNPRTGVQNLAIPGVVAMLAAATAAVTLAGKKK